LPGGSADTNRKLMRQAALSRATTRHVGEQRSATGAGVWKRVRLKLEGRDPPARRPQPQDQVYWTIGSYAK
ncbi:jg3590, partial [Pararge aegeria aegeria]